MPEQYSSEHQPPFNSKNSFRTSRDELSQLIDIFKQLPYPVQQSNHAAFGEILEAVREGSPIGVFLVGPLMEGTYGRRESGAPEALIRLASALVDRGLEWSIPNQESFVGLSRVLEPLYRKAATTESSEVLSGIDQGAQLQAAMLKSIFQVLAPPCSAEGIRLFCRGATIAQDNIADPDSVSDTLRALVDAVKRFDNAPLTEYVRTKLAGASEWFMLGNRDESHLLLIPTIAQLATKLTFSKLDDGAQLGVVRVIQTLARLGPNGIALIPEITEIASRANDTEYLAALTDMISYHTHHNSFSGAIGALLFFRAAAPYPELIQFPKAAVAFLAASPQPTVSEVEQYVRRLGVTVAARALSQARTEEEARPLVLLLASCAGFAGSEALLLLRNAGIGEEMEAYRAGQIRAYSPLEQYYAQDAYTLERGSTKAGSFPSGYDENLGGFVALFAAAAGAASSLSRNPSAKDRGKSSNKVPSSGSILIPPAQELLGLWSQLSDKYLGFGAQLFEAKRMPDGEQAPLVEFGLRHGRVRYLNSADNTSFPGRGVLISDLDPALLLAGDRERSDDPFHQYKRAWPSLAKALDYVGEYEYVFARGFVAVSCRSAPFNRMQTVDGEPMALVIFNSHFGNPNNRVAYLMPVRTMQAAIARSLIDASDFTGFVPQQFDPHTVVPSPEAFRSLPGGELLIDLGDPGLILTGFTGDHYTQWLHYNRRMVEHFENTKTFDAWFFTHRGSQLFASVTSTEARSETKMRMEGRGIIRNGTREELSYRTEQQLHEDANVLIADAQQLLQGARKSHPLSDDIVHTAKFLLAGLDLFSIHQANWHRGYTGTRNEDSLEEPQLVEQPDGDDVDLNRDAARRLFEAHRFYTQHLEGVTDRSKYPLLVVSDTLRWSDAPSTSLYLDTWNMKLHIDGQVVQLSTEAIEFDDILFWNSKVLPRAADDPGAMRDLSFRPRGSLGID